MRKESWETFRSAGFLWWINRILHTFGWAIIVAVNNDSGKIAEVYPARVSYRGFDETSEEEGFLKVSEYMKDEAGRLFEEIEE